MILKEFYVSAFTTFEFQQKTFKCGFLHKRLCRPAAWYIDIRGRIVAAGSKPFLTIPSKVIQSSRFCRDFAEEFTSSNSLALKDLDCFSGTKFISWGGRAS